VAVLRAVEAGAKVARDTKDRSRAARRAELQGDFAGTFRRNSSLLTMGHLANDISGMGTFAAAQWSASVSALPASVCVGALTISAWGE
jgi:hypothetical protein